MLPKEYTGWGEFCRLFDASPRNRVLEFFLDMSGLDYTPGDIAEFTGLSRATTYRTMDALLAEGYLVPTRKVSGVQLYILNKQKREVTFLLKISRMLDSFIVDSYTSKHLLSTKTPSLRKQLLVPS